MSKPNSKSKQPTKQDRITTLLKRSKGATLAELGKASEWQEHSIRGFISGTLKKRLKLNVESGKDAKGVRRYRIVEPALNEKIQKTNDVAVTAETVAG